MKGAPRSIADRSRPSALGTAPKPPSVRGFNRTAAHTALVSEIRLALGREPDLVLWPNAVKHIEALTANGIIHMTTGLAKGSSDLVGILGPRGRFIALEVKTGNAVAEPHQLQWLNLVRMRGGFAAVVKSVEEAQDAIARARDGGCQ